MANLQRPSLILDPIGFPMIYCQDIEAYIHWLPFTKIQMEYFLCDAQDSAFDADWYHQRLSENKRISPQHINIHNYFHIFATSLLPSEMRKIAAWMGEAYAIPTSKEWLKAHAYFSNDRQQYLFNWDLNKPRITTVIKKLHDVTDRLYQGVSEIKIYQNMLMRWGTLEWVQQEDTDLPWAVCGETHPQFYGHVSAIFPEPQPIKRAEIDRLPFAGFRLIKRLNKKDNSGQANEN